MTVVLDSNILIAFALTDEPLHSQANQILSTWEITETRLVAPRLFRSEITSVVRKAVYQRRITNEEGDKLLSQLLLYPVEFIEDDALLKSAYVLAHRFNRPRAYDSQYMALAARLDCEFWTADEALVKSIQSEFQHVRWLGEFLPHSQ